MASQSALSRAPRRADSLAEVLIYAIGHKELRILGPAVAALDEPHLVRTERLAVSGRRILYMRRAVADVALNQDERRLAAGPRRND